MDVYAMTTHYKYPDHRGKLWTPPLNGDVEEVVVPLLLAIPLVLFCALQAKGCPLMLHKVHAIVNTLSHWDDAIADEAEWQLQLVLNWCLIAAQVDSKGNSLVSFVVNVVTDGNDDYLGRWIDNRLDSTMGARPRGGPSSHMATATPTQDMHRVLAFMATEFGKGVALGLRSLGPLCIDQTLSYARPA